MKMINVAEHNIWRAAGEYLAFDAADLRNSADPVLVSPSVGGTAQAGTSSRVTCSRRVSCHYDSLNQIALAQTPQCLREGRRIWFYTTAKTCGRFLQNTMATAGMTSMRWF